MYAVEYWIGSQSRKLNPQTTGPMGFDDASRFRDEQSQSGFIAYVVASEYRGQVGSGLHGGEKLSIHGRKR